MPTPTLRHLPTGSLMRVLRGTLIGLDMAIKDAEKFRRKALDVLNELAGRQGAEARKGRTK